MKTDTQKTLSQLLESLGVTVESRYLGFQREPGEPGKPDWPHFAFAVTVRRAGESDAIETPYRMGMAHANNPHPKPADVLHSLLSDGDAYFDSLTFEEWAANLGFDPDSRKAEAAYRACDETGRRLARMFSPDELAQLREAASEY